MVTTIYNPPTIHEFTLIQSSPALDTVKLHYFYKKVGIKSYFILVDKITRVNLKNMVSERSQMQKTKYCMTPFVWNSRSFKTIVTGHRSVVAWGQGRVSTAEKGMKKLFRVIEMLYILVVVDVTWMNIIHQIVHLKWVNSIVCKVSCISVLRLP